MSGNGEKITRHQERAIAALIEQSTLAAAARVANISEATLRRWMKQPAFSVEYAAARRGLVSNTVKNLHKAGNAALATLIKIMANDQASAAARAAAARTVLELGLRERPVGIHLEAPTTTGRISQGLAKLIQAATSGEVLPEEAKAIASIFRTQLDAVAVAELERRLAALEENHARGESESGEDEEAA